MKTNELKVLANKALKKWGDEPQIRQTMEECAELIVALNKSMRDIEDSEAVRYNILEEMADVTIMLEQMKKIFDRGGEFDHALQSKMDKLSSYLREQETEE